MRKLICLFLLCLSWPSLLPAMTVGGLYEARVSVADQSDGERRQALPKAMGQVLIKLTGEPGIVNDGRAKPLINQARNYLQQYRYLDPEGENDTLRLAVSFDPTSVDEALRRQGIAAWGKERPATLVWLAVTTADGSQLVGMEQSPPDGRDYLWPITRQAHERGLPLLLPLMDLEDSRKLEPRDISNGSVDAIRNASRRYPADGVLAVNISGAGSEQVSARWTYLPGEGGSDSWRSQGGSVNEVLESGMNRLADQLAQRYAPKTFAGEASILSLTVNAVNSLEDYARAQTYLQGLSSVSQVQVKRVSPGSVVFEVRTLGGAASLEQSIRLGRTLSTDDGAAPDGGEGRSYRLLR